MPVLFAQARLMPFSKRRCAMPSAKLDLYKLHKAEYATPKAPQLIDVDKASYLAIQGKGEPGGNSFRTKWGRFSPLHTP
jgi:hypothetical protein